MTTMKTLREQQRDRQRAEQAAYVAQVLAQAGSVRQAAKLAGLQRVHFNRLRRMLGQIRPILQSPAPPATK
jgi:hypothetical protein